MEIIKSKNKNKKYTAIIMNENNEIEYIDFGSKNSQTFIDHKDQKKRYNYFIRHYNNDYERKYIDNLILSPALLSLFILWNDKGDIYENMKYLNNIIKNNNKFNIDMLF